MVSFRCCRQRLVVVLGLCVLVLSTLPLLAAFALALPCADREHEVTALFDRGVVHAALHHGPRSDVRQAHRHTRCESLLLGDSPPGHPDHEFSAGSPGVSVESDPPGHSAPVPPPVVPRTPRPESRHPRFP